MLKSVRRKLESQAGRKRGQLEKDAEIMSWQELPRCSIDPILRNVAMDFVSMRGLPHELLEEETSEEIIWGMQAINLI